MGRGIRRAQEDARRQAEEAWLTYMRDHAKAPQVAAASNANDPPATLDPEPTPGFSGRPPLATITPTSDRLDLYGQINQPMFPIDDLRATGPVPNTPDIDPDAFSVVALMTGFGKTKPRVLRLSDEGEMMVAASEPLPVTVNIPPVAPLPQLPDSGTPAGYTHVVDANWYVPPDPPGFVPNPPLAQLLYGFRLSGWLAVSDFTLGLLEVGFALNFNEIQQPWAHFPVDVVGGTKITLPAAGLGYYRSVDIEARYDPPVPFPYDFMREFYGYVPGQPLWVFWRLMLSEDVHLGDTLQADWRVSV